MKAKLSALGAFLIGIGLMSVLVFGHILQYENGFMIPGIVCLAGVLLMAFAI